MLPKVSICKDNYRKRAVIEQYNMIIMWPAGFKIHKFDLSTNYSFSGQVNSQIDAG